MRESEYQAKIIKAIESIGGIAINGQFTSSGEHDLQCGYPVDGKLLHLTIEVKTESDYHRVMEGVREVDGLYEIVDQKKLKKHEPMQVYKANRNRKLGGLSLFAYCIEQVKEYVNDQTKTSPDKKS